MQQTSSQVVDTNSTSHPDLFPALKGGGNNLGMVMQVELQAFKQGPLWGGPIGHRPASIHRQVSALVNLTGHLVDDLHAQVITIWHYNGKLASDVVAGGVQYTLGVETPPIFHEFLNLPRALSTLRVTNIYDLMMEAAPLPGKRALFLTLTFRNDARVLEYLNNVHCVHERR
ncbi:uncharacterized protein BJX67DRAFT_347634 [Aspergillus lucknowensis]|uniref:Uncharacterized protein n=1 Tax=Aspergillus lucknowensis TaxID=176173 RepID=A0ABR4M1W3_9EURO